MLQNAESSECSECSRMLQQRDGQWISQKASAIVRDSIGVSISACHADDPGPIPGLGGSNHHHWTTKTPPRCSRMLQKCSRMTGAFWRLEVVVQWHLWSSGRLAFLVEFVPGRLPVLAAARPCGCPSLQLLRGTLGVYLKEVRAYNRSVMPLDGLGCTCATMTESASITLLRREWAIF